MKNIAVQKYQFLVDNILDTIFEMGLNGKFIYISPQCVDLLGYHQNELMNASILDYIHPEDISNVKESILKAKQSQNIFSSEFRMIHKNGNEIYISTKGNLVNAKGKQSILAVGRDITENKRIEKKLKESEENYRLITENANDMIFKLNEKLEFEYINEGVFKKVMGYTKEDLLGTPSIENIHPEDRKKITRDLFKDFKSSNGTIELRIKDKYGNYHWQEVRGQRIIDSAGNKKAILIGRDITDRKKMEKKLKQSEELLNKITDQTFMGFAIFQDFDIKYFSPAFAEAIGYSQEEISAWKTREFFKVIHPDDQNKLISLAQKLYSGDNNALNFLHFRINKKSGQIIWVETQTNTIIYDGKKADMVFIQNITPKIEAEQKIKESEEKFRILFESSPYAVSLIDSKGVVVQVNSNIEKIFGYTREEILGKSFKNFHPFSKDDSRVIFDSFSKLLKGETPESQELQLHRKDGPVIWVLIQASIVKLANETLFQVITQDISDQKLAEEKLKQSEEKYRNMINSLDVGFFRVSFDGMILDHNPKFNEIFGIEPTQNLIGTQSFNLWQDSKDRKKFISELRERGFVKDYISPAKKITGEKIILQGNTHLIMNDQGIPVASEGTIIDITEKYVLEQELKESEEKYRLITEHANDLIDVLDEKFRYEYINEETHKRVLGYSREDMIGKFAGKFVHPDEMEEIVEKLRVGFDNGVGMTECRIRKKDRTYIWYESKGKIFRDSNGNKKALIMSRDITERRLAEEKIRRSEALLSDAQRIAHLGHWEWNILTNKIFWSDELYRMYKRPRDYKPTIKEWLTHVHPEDFEKNFNSIRDNISGTDLHNKEFRIICTDGELKHIHAEWEIDRDEHHKPIRAFGIILDITERKMSEQKLRESEKNYRTTVSNIPGAVFHTDKNWKMQYISEAIQKISGYPPSKFIKKSTQTYANLLHPDDIKRVSEAMINCIQKRIPLQIEYRIFHADGTIRWIQDNSNALYDDKGNFLGFSGVLLDVTKRKSAEQKLRESEEKFFKAFNNNFVAMAISDLKEGRFIECNEVFIKNLGFKREDVIGKTAQELKLWKDKDSRDEIIRSIQEKESISNLEIISETDDGEFRCDLFSANLIEINNEPFLLSMTNNITDRILAKRKLKESEENYRLISENANDLIVIINKNSIIEYINKRPLVRNYGYTPEEIIGEDIKSFINPNYLESYGLNIKNLFRRDKGTIELELRHKKGYYCPVEVSVSIFFDNNNNPKQLIFVRDITARKRAEQKLKESEEKYRLIAEDADDLISLYNENLNLEYINEQTHSKLLGYSIERLNNLAFKIFITHKDDVDNIKNASKVCFKKGKVTYQLRLKHKNGHYLWFETKGKVFTGQDDRKKILYVSRDITERKKAEQKLKESEEKYRLITENAYDLIAVLNEKFEHEFINEQTYLNVLGYNNNDMLGKTRWEIIHPEDFNKAIEELKLGFEMGKGSIELRLRHKQGHYLWFEFKGKRFIDKEGKIKGLLIARDITERKKAEQQLKESEEKFRTITEQSLMGICIAQDNKIKYINKKYAEIWGYDIEEMMQWEPKDAAKVIYPDDRAFALEQFVKKQKGEQDIVAQYQYRGIKKSGEIIWVDNYSNSVIYRGHPADLLTLIDITEKKAAEQKLRESEEKYRNIIENTKEGYFEVDLKGNFTFINDAFCRFFKYSSEEIIGKSFKMFATKEMAKKTYKTFNVVYRTAIEQKNFEFEVITKNGSIAYGETTIHLRFDSEGNIIGFSGFMRDITEKKRAETELRESEEKFRHLFENSPFAILLFDSGGKIIDCNSAIERMFGVNRQLIINQDYLLMPELNDKQKMILKERFQSLMSGESVEPVELRIIRRDGSIRWINSRVSKITIKNQTLFYSIIQDITERKILENLMFELNQVFFNFTADVKENIRLLLQTIIKLSKGTLVLYTRKFFDKEKQIVQIISSENELYTHHVEEFKKIYFMSEIFEHNHELPQVFSNLHENTQLRGDPFIQKHKIKGAYGKVINSQDEYKSAISILYEHNPEVSDEDQLILLLISDAIAIEERRWQLLQKLEEQNKKLSDIDKLKSEFLRRISHELKTPLISIKGYSELILHQNKDFFDIDTISMIEEIIQGCSRLENLVIELLKTSKLETGQIELKTSVEDLAFLIRFTVKELHGLAKTRNQKITLNIHEKLITRFEKERIHEVVGNLLTNAIKYTPPYGMIEIKSDIKKNLYIISVKDNGIGFTQAEKEKVFKQFGKIEHYGRGSYISTEGTGLGLYITKKLVELHGGEVWMESEGRNRGSIFYFSLPILKE